MFSWWGDSVGQISDVPFRLDIVEVGDQWVVTCASPRGRAVNRIPAPFTPDVLHRMLSEVEKALIRSYSPVTTRRAAPVEQNVRVFGQTLSGAVLAGDVRRVFDRCRQEARDRHVSLRVLLDTDGSNVSAIPWEFAADPDAPDDYLALRIPIVRAPHLIDPVPSSRVALPLRVLGVSSVPADLPALDVQRERDDISRAFRERLPPGDVRVEWLRDDRWSDLAEAIRSHQWHVLHIMCHGGYDPEAGSGYLQLSADDGSSREVSAVDLARLVSENASLRLIVLNACESALPGAEGVFTSTAAKLVRAGVPAVVAMQYEITDDAALTFASSFYGEIARGLAVDRALTRAREAVKMTNDSLEWATPVLFISSEETQIFEVPGTPPPPREPPAEEQRPDPEPGSQEPSRSQSPALRKLRALPPTGPSSQMAAGPGDIFAVAGNDGAVRVINTATDQVLSECRLPQRTRPVCLAWSPWPRHLASLHEDGMIVVWDAETEVPVRILQIPAPELLRTAARHISSLRAVTQRMEALAFTSDGKWLVASSGGCIHFFDAAGNHTRALRFDPDKAIGGRLFGAKLGPSRIMFAPGDRSILVTAGDGAVLQLDAQGRTVQAMRHPQPVLGMAVTDDRLATGCADGRVRIWSWNGELMRRADQGSPVEYLAFAPDGTWLATASVDGTLSLWDRDGASAGKTTLAGRPIGLRCTRDTVLTANHAGALELWSVNAQAGGRRDGS